MKCINKYCNVRWNKFDEDRLNDKGGIKKYSYGWNEYDEDYWAEGKYVRCPNNCAAFVNTPPPLWCLFKLEHMLLEEKTED